MANKDNNADKPGIMLVIMGQSPYNRSIWTGFADGFQSLGCPVTVVDAREIPDPDTLSERPRLLFSVHGANTPVEKIAAYRKAGALTAVYLLDEPYEVDRSIEWAKHYDYVFSVDRATVPVHQQFTRATHLPLAYNQRVFNPQVAGIPSRILVLGTPFSAREKHLAVIRDRWGDLVTWVGPGWQDFSPQGTHYEHFVTPPDCARFYRGADIVINIHRDSWWSHFGELNRDRIGATHLNPRFWETIGCRSFQLCSYRSDLDDYDAGPCAFRSIDEMVQKIDYFLNNEKARKEQVKRVYKKVKTHTYDTRSRTVLKTVGI